MYGIIGTAVITGIAAVWLLKLFKVKDVDGVPLAFADKEKRWKNYLFGGIIFGLGWALTGACPGPMFVLLGYGYLAMLITIAGALLGTLAYGVVKDKLP